MKINSECTVLSEDSVRVVEEKYDAKFVFETCLKSASGSWYNFPVAVFYTEKKHPDGSNYFAMYRNCDGWMITDASSAIEDFYGLAIGDEVYYSRYRHDYRAVGDSFVDGGREYLRYGGRGTPVKIRVVKDRLELAET